MNKWISLLLLFLSISLSLNFYLLSDLPQQEQLDSSKVKNSNVQQSPISDALLNWNVCDLSTNETSQTSQPIYLDNPTNNTPFNPLLKSQVTNRAVLLTQANLWLKEKNCMTKFESVLFFLQNIDHLD